MPKFEIERGIVLAKKAKKPIVVAWKDAATIEEAANIHKDLLNAFQSGQEIVLHLAEITDIDMTGVQLILSAQKESEKTGVPFYIQEPVPDFVFNLLNTLGISIEGIKLIPAEETHA